MTEPPGPPRNPLDQTNEVLSPRFAWWGVHDGRAWPISGIFTDMIPPAV